MPERVGEVAQPPGSVQDARRGAIQGILDRDQIADLIGKRGRLIQRVLDRERLALGIDREGRDLAQRIGNRREIPCDIVAERGGVVQGIFHGGDLVKDRFVGHGGGHGLGRGGEPGHAEGIACALVRDGRGVCLIGFRQLIFDGERCKVVCTRTTNYDESTRTSAD